MGFFSSFLTTLRNTRTQPQNSQTTEELKHSKSYSDLLTIYVKSVEDNTNLKKWFKILFFIFTMGSLIAIIIFFGLSLKYACSSFLKFEKSNNINTETILSVITVLFPSFASLIVAFIKIPEIIAKYLFNIQEDKYMNSVIKNIQDYDKSMFALRQRAENVAILHRTEMEQDEVVETSPRENTAI